MFCYLLKISLVGIYFYDLNLLRTVTYLYLVKAYFNYSKNIKLILFLLDLFLFSASTIKMAKFHLSKAALKGAYDIDNTYEFPQA